MGTRVLVGIYGLAAAGLAASFASASAHASPASEVASAFDQGDDIDVHMRLDYFFDVQRAAIERELAGAPGTQERDPLAIAKDLVFEGTRHTLVPELEIGVFRDISLTIALPVVLYDARKLEFDQRDEPCTFGGGAATCIDASNSTTVRDGLLPPQGFDSQDPGGPGFTDASDPTLFRSPNRSGLDQIDLGLIWAAMNQERDDTKPTWKLGAEVRLSIGKIMRFSATDPDAEDGVSRGVHELHLWTSMARRMGWAEPRFRIWYTAPIGERDESLFVDYGFGQRSESPQQSAGAEFGLEAAIWTNEADQQRVSVDLGADLSAYFEGRAYTPMWEVFAYAGRPEVDGPLVIDTDPTQPGVQEGSFPGVTNVENFLRFGSHVGLTAELGPHVRLGAKFYLFFDQDHLITFADAGTDGSDTGTLIDPNTDEVNPAYSDLIDLVGRRYRLEEAVSYVTQVEARVLF